MIKHDLLNLSTVSETVYYAFQYYLNHHGSANPGSNYIYEKINLNLKSKIFF